MPVPFFNSKRAQALEPSKTAGFGYKGAGRVSVIKPVPFLHFMEITTKNERTYFNFTAQEQAEQFAANLETALSREYYTEQKNVSASLRIAIDPGS